MHIRAQNAAVIVRRLATADFVQFEVFEVLPLIRTVMETEGKLLRSYPGPVIQIPAIIFMDERFLPELSSVLVHMNVERLRHPPLIDSPNTNVHDAPHPGYISTLLVGILGEYGRPAVVDRITKRIGDEVLLDVPDDNQSHGQVNLWRRSPLWLTLRVTLQSSLLSSNLYKPFILFFHAHLLRSGVRRHLPSELLYVMRVKMARRLSKLHPAHSHHIYQFVHDTAKETEALLSNRWTAFQEIGSLTPALQLEGLDFVEDSQISLCNSYKYLTKVLRSASYDITQNQFTPSDEPRLYSVHNFSLLANGELAKAITKDTRIAITDFELCVERNLDSWIASSRNNEDTLDVIASCIEQYFASAKDLYGTSPEDISVMILTIMDLWVALDSLAIQGCPLLKEYSPEIPSNFLHCLLLHRSGELKRALHIEEYLCRRHKEALDVPSILSNCISDSSFAVKYFRSSKELRRIYDKITRYAHQERDAKRIELASLKQPREMSKWLGDMGYHQYVGRTWDPDAKDEAEAPKIDVHEWPLPHPMAHAQLAVFELSPPHTFAVWRDITYGILYDICLHEVKSVNHSTDHPPLLLDSFSGLRQWASQHQRRRRVTIASTTPSFSDQKVEIWAEESSILIDNPLSFQLFDRIHESWVIESFSGSSPAKLCVPSTPESSPYNHLHHFVSSTKHTPNDVVTAQAHCPQEINLHEFVAFSGLRSGPRLQWLNIARELASPFLSFSREEVHTLITQAAWQLGPLLNGVREWHMDLGIFGFGNALLCEMECLLEKIKANWKEEVTVRTIGMSDPFHLHLYLIWFQLLSAVVFWSQQLTLIFLCGRVLCCGRLEASHIDG
jgi:hypothetical protein